MICSPACATPLSRPPIMQESPSTDPYRLWELVGVWLSAIGTLGAVIVSLWLASRASRPQLRILVDKRVLISQVQSGRHSVQLKDFPDVVYLEATNIGTPPIHIIGVSWSLRFPWCLRSLSRGALLQSPPDAENRSSGLPARLEHAQTMQWSLPHQYIVENIAEKVIGNSIWSRLWLSRLRLNIFTSVGTTFHARLAPDLISDMAKLTSSFKKVKS